MGSRLTANGTERVYAAADLWVKRALWIDDSLFTPGKPIWSKECTRRSPQAVPGPAGRVG